MIMSPILFIIQTIHIMSVLNTQQLIRGGAKELQVMEAWLHLQFVAVEMLQCSYSSHWGKYFIVKVSDELCVLYKKSYIRTIILSFPTTQYTTEVLKGKFSSFSKSIVYVGNTLQ